MEEKLLSNDKLHLVISNDIVEISSVINRFTEFCNDNEVTLPNTQRISIVVDEMLNNIINYGYKDEKKHFIEIFINLEDTSVIIKIIDDGQPFNPFQLESPKLDIDLIDREIGGLGVYMTQQIMNEVRYARSDNKNIITLIKNS
jgi:sigma-B regulation protein RsbU (phosphoserine phosphatase)